VAPAEQAINELLGEAVWACLLGAGAPTCGLGGAGGAYAVHLSAADSAAQVC